MGEVAIATAPAAELERAERALRFFYRNAPPGLFLDLDPKAPLPLPPQRPRRGSWVCGCGRPISANKTACVACGVAE